MAKHSFSGILVPVVTPFTANGDPDTARFVAFCKELLADGADGLAVFGTTSEGNSLSLGERKRLLEALVGGGVPAEKLMPGTGACSIPDAAEAARHATELGCGGVLMLPPFYYKGVSDDGLFGFVDRVIDRVASDRLAIYLYHIPPVAVIGWSLDLIGRLRDAFPETVVGLKDSSGDWSNTAAILNRFPDFAVFPGSELFLLDALRKGGAGCITASGNVNVRQIRRVFELWRTPDADAAQQAVSTTRKALQSFPMIPALKTIIAHRSGDDRWLAVRPPLVPLATEQRRKLIDTFAGHDILAPREAVAAE